VRQAEDLNLEQQQDAENLLDRQRKHFNSIAERYKAGRSGANHLYLKDLMWTSVLGDITRFKGKRIKVLEAMCGFGDGLNIARTYLSDDVDYSGYDYSDTVVEMLKKQQPSINVWQADATTYQPPVSEYDAVFIIGGIHHVPDHAQKVVELCAKALRPGGLFISFEPTSGNTVFRKARDLIYKKNTLFDEKTERAFEVNELLNMFKSQGLKPVKVLHPGLLSYVLYYNPDAFPYLNIGGKGMVRSTYGIDKLFYGNAIGRTLSFATLSVWERP
jgi:SAM-dependent methyltransferase